MNTNQMLLTSESLDVQQTAIFPVLKEESLTRRLNVAMCFVGYSKNSKDYRLMDLSTEKFVTRRDVRLASEVSMKVVDCELLTNVTSFILLPSSGWLKHNQHNDSSNCCLIVV